MQARVKSSARQSVITSCAGRHFIKSAWLPVPPGFESEAERNPFLEVCQTAPEPPAPAENIAADEPEAEVNATNGAIKLAHEYGVDLVAVSGSGKDGKVQQRDVEKYLEGQTDAA